MASLPTSFRRPSRLRRVTLAALAALATTSLAPVLASPGGTVSASTGRSTSPTVASSASSALDAYEDWSVTGDPDRFVAFLGARDRAAADAAGELGLDGVALVAAWQRTDPTKQVALLAALSQLGVPYRRNASVEGEGFDCSGLTTYAYARAGVQLTRSSGTQIGAAARVERTVAEAGDLVHYPGHVMMYLGVGDAIVHSRNTGSHVELSTISRSSVRFGDPLG